jgi:hypothetical protein
MADKLTSIDVSRIAQKSDVVSGNLDKNYTNLKNKTNEVIDTVNAASIGTTNAETTAARPYHISLKERLDSINSGQYPYVKYGGVVSEISTGVTMNVEVTAGEANINGIDVKWTAGASATITKPTTNNRFDVVVANTDSTVTIVTGAESASPVLPVVASTQKALAYITLTPSTLAIYDADITDCRNQGCVYFKDGRLAYEWKIQDAIDDLTSGGTIFIGDGNYYETLTFANSQILDFAGDAKVYTPATGVEFDLADANIGDKTDSCIKWNSGISFSNGVIKSDVFSAFEIIGKIGTDYAISGLADPAVASMTPSLVAVVNGNAETITALRHNGETWTIEGSVYTYGGTALINPTVTALSATRIAMIEENDETLQVYDFNGSTWSATGTGLNISTIDLPLIAALSSTTIAFCDQTNSELRTYQFNGSTWSQVGNSLSITDPWGMTSLTSTRVVVANASDELQIYSWDGTNWTAFGSATSASEITQYTAITALSNNRIVNNYEDGKTYVYDYNGSTWDNVGIIFNTGRTAGNIGGISAMSSNRFAYIDEVDDDLSMFYGINANSEHPSPAL